MSLVGWHTILGEGAAPYMTRIWIGRLRLHVFYRGDADPDCHDHPWDFWTLPLTSYVEEFVLPDRFGGGFERHEQVVRAFRLHFRPAEHTHRVLGRHELTLTPEDLDWLPGPLHLTRPGRIVTLVWRGPARRRWGFLKHRAGRWCWQPWRAYVLAGGKHAPCGPEDAE